MKCECGHPVPEHDTDLECTKCSCKRFRGVSEVEPPEDEQEAERFRFEHSAERD